jgi:hypothetical protein
MSKYIDQKIADSALATEHVDQPMDFKMSKIGDVTYITLIGNGSLSLAVMRAFGTSNPDFFHGLLQQVANAGSKGEGPDEIGIKFILAFIKDLEPRDEIDALLKAQMAATHVATMRFANRLAHAESLQEQDSAERAYNKLARTFVAQVEAFQRYRTTGEEKVIVQHVSVSDGGQAIVGNVTGPADETALKKRVRVTPVLADARQFPMAIIGEPQRAPIPLRRRPRG